MLRAVFRASPPAGRARPPPASRSTAMDSAPRWLAGLRFDNQVLRALPVETPPPGSEDALSVPRTVAGACFSRARPARLRQPRVVALSGPALALLGLPEPDASVEAEAALFFSGNALLPGAEPAAHCYCGHQFGQFAGQLGDGAAMYLGEVCTEAGERWEMQLKGAGPTAFSRCAVSWGPRHAGVAAAFQLHSIPPGSEPEVSGRGHSSCWGGVVARPQRKIGSTPETPK